MDEKEITRTEKAKQWLEKVQNSTDPYDPLITYYFINKPLGMSPGKIGTQTARAGQVMMLGELQHDDSLLFQSLSELFEDDFMHGNKTICLKANETQLNRLLTGDLHTTLVNLDVPVRTYAVHDIGATEVETNSLTVVAITPVPESIIKPFAKKFQLYQ